MNREVKSLSFKFELTARFTHPMNQKGSNTFIHLALRIVNVSWVNCILYNFDLAQKETCVIRLLLKVEIEQVSNFLRLIYPIKVLVAI